MSGQSTRELALGTDIPLNSPPRAVERWNRGDHREFPSTNRSRSIHPPDASLSGGRYVEDAYVEIFSIQPSTRARLSSSRTPLYVAPSGSLLGTVDYRVDVPENDTSGDRRVRWRLEDHEIDETHSLVDGVVVATGGGSHTPSLRYRTGGNAGTSHSFGLRATISVTLRKNVTVCTNESASGACLDWQSTVTYPTERVTVGDSVGGVTYALGVSGTVATYPDGDLGLLVHGTLPWSGYTLPDGDVRGVWRFYAARDTDWDTLVYRTEGRTERVHSPLHPLQVAAFPIETGPTAFPRDEVSILAVSGEPMSPPSLPATVNLDVMQTRYTGSHSIVARVQSTQALGGVHVRGLVRGVGTDLSEASVDRIPIHRSVLSLTVLNTTATMVTVQARLQEARTGDPIATASRDGYLVLAGRRVNTTQDGTVSITVPKPPDGITARYEPGRWWLESVGYTGTTDAVLLDGPTIDAAGRLYRLGVPVALYLLGAFLVDRFTTAQLWPPWRVMDS